MSQTESQANEAAQVFGAALLIDVEIEQLNGERLTIAITPFRGKQVAGVLSCINDLVDADIDLTNLKSLNNFSDLATKAPDIAFKLIAECITPEPDAIRRPKAVAESVTLVGFQRLEELSMLAMAVWTVNKNYFQKKGPAILATLGIEPALIETINSQLAGLALLPPSSPADTV